MQQYATLPAQQEKSYPRLLWERKGLLGWWLNLTAPPRPTDLSSLQVREYVRRSELTSLVAVGIFCFALGLISASLNDPHVAQDVITTPIILVIALIFNRFGKITIAAYIILGLVVAAIIIPSLEMTSGYDLDWFLAFDVLTLPVFLSALIIHRRASWFFSAFSIIFLLLYYIYYPHLLISAPGAHKFDEMQYGISVYSWWGEIAEPIFLNLFAGLFGWLAALTFESALTWGEQARNEANVAKEIAAYKDSAEKDMSQFVQEIAHCIVALDSGRLILLQERPPADPMHNIVIFLNNQFKKIVALRARNANGVNQESIRKGIELLCRDLMQAYVALEQGRLYLLQEQVPIDLWHPLVALLNEHFNRIATDGQLEYSGESTEVRRLLDVLVRAHNQPGLLKFLAPDPGHSFSSSQEVNQLAGEIYKLLSARSQSGNLRENNLPSGQIFRNPGRL